jgi:GT2 family glycosyltransferase
MSNYQKRIYIIIPVHNRKRFTRDCLLSIRKQAFQKIITIVIDDGSSDGTSAMIHKEFPEVVLLQGDGNLWWTGATNLGVKYALENATQRDYILTMNEDTIIRPNYLDTLLVCASKHPKSLIGSIALVKSGNDLVIEDGGVKIYLYTAKFNRLARGRGYKTVINEEPSVRLVDVLSGRGTLIPAEVYQEVGLYDSVHLPQYGADYEFSLRAKKKGYNLFINYKSVVVNKVRATDINSKQELLKWGEFGKSLVSKSSPYCIRYRLNFAWLTCPKALFPSFFIFDISRLIIGFMRTQLKYKMSFYGDVR